MDDLDRLHERLVANVREGFPHLLERSFRLGDIAEHLVPYRTNRPALRFESARQYEVALMRLASGERGYLRVEPAVADGFRRALAAPEPDAAVLRDHALASVTLTNGGAASTAGAVSAPSGSSAPAPSATFELPALPPSTPPAPPPATAAEAIAGGWTPYDTPALDAAWPPTEATQPPPPAPAAEAPPPPARAPQPQMQPPSESQPGPTAIGGPCRYCGQALPEGRPVTYCPHCGQNVTVRHCPACSTELEIGWHFCITCGRAMDEGSLHTGGR